MKSSISPHRILALGFLALGLLAPLHSLRADETKLHKVTPATKEYDLDGDGFLNEAEAAKAKEGARKKAKATREENLAKYDTNKDGKLDEQERARRDADRKAAKEAKKLAKQSDATDGAPSDHGNN